MSRSDVVAEKFWNSTPAKLVKYALLLCIIVFFILWVVAFECDLSEKCGNWICGVLWFLFLAWPVILCAAVICFGENPVHKFKFLLEAARFYWPWFVHAWYFAYFGIISLSAKRSVDGLVAKGGDYRCVVSVPIQALRSRGSLYAMDCKQQPWRVGRADMMFWALGLFCMVAVECVVVFCSILDFYKYRDAPEWFKTVSVYPVAGFLLVGYVGESGNPWHANIKSVGMSAVLMAFIAFLTITYMAKAWELWLAERRRRAGKTEANDVPNKRDVEMMLRCQEKKFSSFLFMRYPTRLDVENILTLHDEILKRDGSCSSAAESDKDPVTSDLADSRGKYGYAKGVVLNLCHWIIDKWER